MKMDITHACGHTKRYSIDRRGSYSGHQVTRLRETGPKRLCNECRSKAATEKVESMSREQLIALVKEHLDGDIINQLMEDES